MSRELHSAETMPAFSILRDIDAPARLHTITLPGFSRRPAAVQLASWVRAHTHITSLRAASTAYITNRNSRRVAAPAAPARMRPRRRWPCTNRKSLSVAASRHSETDPKSSYYPFRHPGEHRVHGTSLAAASPYRVVNQKQTKFNRRQVPDSTSQ